LLSRTSRAQPISPPAGCGIKRIQSASTLVDLEHDHHSAGFGGFGGFGAGPSGAPSSLAELEASFHMYFDRLLTELLKRVVARRRAEAALVDGTGATSSSGSSPPSC
jgi:hypothetical protein